MLYREALESANLMKISLVSATAVLATCLLALANTAHTAQAASFPQNGKIAFQSSDRIYTVEPDGSNQRPLTPGLYPNWSPDGTEIVFQGSARKISVMSANGSDIRSITHEANERIVGYWPAWSADGKVVAFSDTRLVKTGQGGYLVYDIFMLGLDDSEQTNLTNTPKIDEWDADFSPDGSQICFTRSEPWVPEPKHSGIYVMDVHGSDPTPLFESVSQGTCDWAPDGKKIVFSAISDHQKKAPQMEVYVINADGSGLTNLTSNSAMDANPAWSPDGTKIVFSSDRDGGGFDIPDDLAQAMINVSGNPNARPNSDVVKRVLNASDVMRLPRNFWTIDFGPNMSLEEATLYEMPFEHVKRNVYPVRMKNRRKVYREKWWIYQEPRIAMREALKGLSRYIVTPRVAKHRVFVWAGTDVMANDLNVVIALEDDYSIGVLHSRAHELWAIRMGTFLGAGNDPRYTSTTTFETFPFPWPPGKEPGGDSRIEAIAEAARRLDELRRNWLNPEGASEAELKKRTLTNLYNASPTWLENAHERLDEAVFAAYGWTPDLSDEEVLQNLLVQNLERSELEQESGIELTDH